MVEALLWLSGVFCGFGILIIVRRKNNAGTLRVDQSDPSDAPYLFLDLDQPVSIIRKKRFVVLRVKNQNYISHK